MTLLLTIGVGLDKIVTLNKPQFLPEKDRETCIYFVGLFYQKE